MDMDLECWGFRGGDIKITVKKELCEKVVELGWVSDRVMAVVFVIYESVLRLTCGYTPQSGKSFEEK